MPNEEKEEKINTDDLVEMEDDFILEADEENLKRTSFNKDKDIKEELKKCREEKQEYLDGWQRARADLINAKKDFEEQRKDFAKYAKGDLISQIIPVLDSFDMAFINTAGVPEAWLSGVKYIYSQFVSILESNGVKQIDPIGEKFDANKHMSVENIKVDDPNKDSIIITVAQKGYELNGKILREAKVRVGEFER